MMKKFLALAVVGLFAVSANAAELWIVSLTPGQNEWTGGAPSATNGGAIGSNFRGSGVSPREGGYGVTTFVSGTAKIGVLMVLESGTLGGDQVSFANVFLDDATDEWPTNFDYVDSFGPVTVDPTGVALDAVTGEAVSSDGTPWNSQAAYSTGMVQWVGVGGASPIAPFINDYHIIANDDAATGVDAGPGNTAGLPNDIQLISTITVHGVTVDTEARVLLPGRDPNGAIVTELSDANSSALNYTGAPADGGWGAGNARTKNNAFPIQVVVPEPASLSLLALGAVALLRRRK